MSEWSSYLSGLKWAGINDFLHDAANKHGLSLVVTANPRGLIRETVHFTVKGSAPNLTRFRNDIAKSIVDYNG